jgi:hypothetical protein
MIIGNVNANREAIIQIAVLEDYKNICRRTPAHRG